MDNAAQAQYGTPTANCVACLSPPPPHPLPHTGYAVGWPLVLGVALIATGLLTRRWKESS